MDGVSWDVYGDIPPAKHYVSFEFFRLQDFCILFFYMSTNISNRLFLIKEMVKVKLWFLPALLKITSYILLLEEPILLLNCFFLLFCRDSVRIDHGEKTKNL